MKNSTLTGCFVFLATFELTLMHSSGGPTVDFESALLIDTPSKILPKPYPNSTQQIQPNLAKTTTKCTYQQILRGHCIFSIFE